MQILRSPDLTELRALRTTGEFFWLDLDNPDPGVVEAVGEVLDLHELAIEDTQDFGQRPKIDSYGDQLLMVYFGATDDGGQPSAVEIHLHISSRFVVTVHRGPCREFESVQAMAERRAPESEQALIYLIVDALTDSVLDVLERVAARVDAYESQVFERPRARDRDEMAILRRSLGGLRRVLVSQRQVFERMVERIESLPGLDPSLVSYFRDVGDHLWRAVDETESARESLQGMLDTYTNEVQERLTIVATIFLPLTVVTGFFGQNFNWLINHVGEEWAFWALGIGGLVVSGAAIYAWLVRSGLYQGPGRRSRSDDDRHGPAVHGPRRARNVRRRLRAEKGDHGRDLAVRSKTS